MEFKCISQEHLRGRDFSYFYIKVSFKPGHEPFIKFAQAKTHWTVEHHCMNMDVGALSHLPLLRLVLVMYDTPSRSYLDSEFFLSHHDNDPVHRKRVFDKLLIV